jgi:uncharacterized surface protein with fasciclin (FAS1) repeats
VVPGLLPASSVVGLASAPTLNGKALSISVEGGTVRVDDATVIATDIEASNGIIHVIDKVILPEPIQDIVQLARSTGIFNTLLAAVEAAGLTSVLKGEGPFTVFAPTDEAFAAVPAEALADLLADTEALTAVLTYHVVAGELLAAQVLGSTSLPTVNGAQAPVSWTGRAVPASPTPSSRPRTSGPGTASSTSSIASSFREGTTELHSGFSFPISTRASGKQPGERSGPLRTDIRLRQSPPRKVYAPMFVDGRKPGIAL